MTPFCRENQLVWTQKKISSKESSWCGEPRCKIGSKTGSNSRIQFTSNESKSVPKNLNLGLPTKLGLIYETNHVRLLQHACASHVWALSLEFLSAKKIMHKTQSIRRPRHTHTEAGCGVWHTELLPWCKAYQNHYQGAYWQGTWRYIKVHNFACRRTHGACDFGNCVYS
jgi:hypothetical protein